ncbi:hypothetical protein [Streptomyces sp. NPDC046925]
MHITGTVLASVPGELWPGPQDPPSPDGGPSIGKTPQPGDGAPTP